MHERSVANGDHSFEAKHDGRYTYCFSNEHWSAATKEVSFNVHGIVYVAESDAPSDPLEVEGTWAPIFSFSIIIRVNGLMGSCLLSILVSIPSSIYHYP